MRSIVLACAFASACMTATTERPQNELSKSHTCGWLNRQKAGTGNEMRQPHAWRWLHHKLARTGTIVCNSNARRWLRHQLAATAENLWRHVRQQLRRHVRPRSEFLALTRHRAMRNCGLQGRRQSKSRLCCTPLWVGRNSSTIKAFAQNRSAARAAEAEDRPRQDRGYHPPTSG